MFSNLIQEGIDSLDIICHSIDDWKITETLLPSQYNFKILNFNIRSIEKNFNNFLASITSSNITYDAIILTECRIDSNSIIPQIPGYFTYNTVKQINQNSGIVVYIKDLWSASATEPQFKEADCLVIDILNVITIVAIYRSPSFKNIDCFLEDLVQQIGKYNSNSPLVVTGDININILPTEDGSLSDKAIEYMCILAEYGLSPAITKPTRIKTCLDHIFVRCSSPPVGIVCGTGITDHAVTITGICLNNNVPKQQTRTIKKRNYDKIRQELLSVDWSEIITETDVDRAVSAFTRQLISVIEKHTHIVTISRSMFCIKPWITPGLMRCIRHRDQLHKKCRDKPNEDIQTLIYKRYRNFCNNLLRKLKHQHEMNELNESKGNSKKLWTAIKTICHLNIKKQEPTELLSCQALNPQESIDQCNKYFATVGQKQANVLLQEMGTNENTLSSLIHADTSAQPSSFFAHPTDPAEVERLIMQLHEGKASGIDDISSALIKKIKDSIIVPLTAIFNISLATGIFPYAWKLAVISPIHKCGLKTSPENYRPISLLVIFSKLLEKLMSRRLIIFLESRGLISSKQFGFRQGKSTEDAVTLLTSTVSSLLDRHMNCIGVFLDLSKAFDTVSIPILLNKLTSIGIRGTPLSWFKSYLTDRRQCLRIGKYLSSEQPVLFGVPQGSILGPTLFLLYINDIHDSLTVPNTEIICYADDTVILFYGNDWNSVFSHTEHGLAQVAQWLQRNLLTLNVKKTNYLCFHMTQASAPPISPDIKIHSCSDATESCNCASISRVQYIRYLGVIVDQNLNFKHHISNLTGKLRRTISIFRNLRKVADIRTLRMVYFALCHSLLQYCILSWGNSAKTSLILVERAHRFVLKTMLNKPYRFSTTKLYEEAQLLSVRKSYILKATLKAHQLIVQSPEYHNLLNKRVFKAPLPQIQTVFAGRFGNYPQLYLFNKLNKMCTICKDTKHEAKHKILKLLLNLTYDETESLLHIDK